MSVWNGRVPAETTTHEYDENGRLVRSVTTREAEWTDEDRAVAVAWISYRSSICSCGESLIATTDPRMEGRYEPDGFVQCHKCVGLEQARDPVEKNPDSHPRRHTYRYEIKRLPPRPLQ